MAQIRKLKQSDLLKCPHCILMPQHYRADGTCKCDDPNEHVMQGWGYRWNETTNRWEADDCDQYETDGQ